MKSEKTKQGTNKTLLLAIIVVPLLVALGVVAGHYFTSSDQAEEDTVFAKEEEEVTVPLEEFLVNVNSSSGRSRYVRMEISLSSSEEDAEETINNNLAKVRDAVIYTLYSQTTESVFEEKDGSFALKQLLKERINETLGKEVIKEVYITNIVMQ